MPSNIRDAGRPPVDDGVEARLTPEMLEALDACARAEPDAPGRSETVRRLLHEALSRRGFLKPPGPPDEGKRPDELDATNDD